MSRMTSLEKGKLLLISHVQSNQIISFCMLQSTASLILDSTVFLHRGVAVLRVSSSRVHSTFNITVEPYTPSESGPVHAACGQKTAPQGCCADVIKTAVVSSS